MKIESGTGVSPETGMTETADDAYSRVIERALAAAKDHADTPMDGGFGTEVEHTFPTPAQVAIEKAKREALANLVVPEGCSVTFVTMVPDTGTEPLVTPVIRQPLNEAYADLPA